MTERARLLERIMETLLRIESAHPVRVAIDGPDAAGKTTLADELASTITSRPIIRVSADDFHRDRAARYAPHGDTAEGYYRATFDHEALLRCVLAPLGPDGDRRYQPAIFDHRADVPNAATTLEAPTDAILIVDGVFLLRPESREHWEYRIFLHIEPDETLRRAVERDASLFGSAERARERYMHKYLPGQQLYCAEARPRSFADLVIDNSWPSAPTIV